jgi:hypothetical protein
MTDKDKTVQAGGGIRPDQIHAYAGGICQKCGLDRVKGNFTFCSAPDKTVGGRFARIPHCPGYWAREDGISLSHADAVAKGKDWEGVW